MRKRGVEGSSTGTAHLAHAHDDRCTLGGTVRVVLCELLGWCVACGGYVWWGKAIGQAWECVKAHLRADRFAMLMQWSTHSPRRMCSASRPERGAGREDGVKEEDVTEESAGWMTLRFAAIAAIIRGDQERMGDLTSEGHISRREVSPNRLTPTKQFMKKNNEVGLTHQKSKIWPEYSFTSTHRPSVWRVVTADCQIVGS
jgi:hypothetical protein